MRKGAIPMKKALLTLLALLMTFSPSLCLAEDAALTAVQALVPAAARLIERERDGACLVLEFQDEAAAYEVTLRADDLTPLLLEIDSIRPAAPYEVSENATLHLTVAEEDDRVALNVLFLTEGEDALIVTCLREDGAVLDIERYIGAASTLLTADAAEDLLREQFGGMTFLELDISLDEDTLALTYEGEALLDGGDRYDFRLDAAGKILAWSWEEPDD